MSARRKAMGGDKGKRQRRTERRSRSMTPSLDSDPTSCRSADGQIKHAYWTRAAARDAVERMERGKMVPTGDKVRPYRCPGCGMFHVGHTERRGLAPDLIIIDELVEQLQHVPEGCSVLVPATRAQMLDAGEAGFVEMALIIARAAYPSVSFTGRTLYVGLDDLGPDLHEIVLEMA